MNIIQNKKGKIYRTPLQSEKIGSGRSQNQGPSLEDYSGTIKNIQDQLNIMEPYEKDMNIE